MKKFKQFYLLIFLSIFTMTLGCVFLDFESKVELEYDSTSARSYDASATLGCFTLSQDFLDSSNSNSDYTYTTETGAKVTVEGTRIKLHVHGGKDMKDPDVNLKLESYQSSGSADASDIWVINNTKWQYCYKFDTNTNYYDTSAKLVTTTLTNNGSSLDFDSLPDHDNPVICSGYSYVSKNTGKTGDQVFSVTMKIVAKQVTTKIVIVKDGQQVQTLNVTDYYRELTDHPSYPSYDGFTFNGIYSGTTTSSTKVYNTTERLVSNGGTYYAIYTKNSYYVDVNNFLSGVNDGALDHGFKFSIKFDGVVKGEGITDYYSQVPYGTIVEIYNIKANEGCVYKGYEISVAGVEQSGSSAENIIIKVPSQRVNISLNFEYLPLLTIDANGGVFDGETSLRQQINSTYSVSIPTREGYDFAGWVIDGGYGTLSSIGKINSSYPDPFFKTGTNSTAVYNNAGNSNVTHTYLTTSFDDVSLPTGARVLKVSNIGQSTPGLGGITNNLKSYAKAVFYTVIYAKIPVGYYIDAGSNSYGDGSSRKWLNSNAGTGEWETYVMKWSCGSSGTFSTINYYYLSGTNGTSASPVNWYVGYFGTYDATGLTANENIASNITFTFGDKDTRLVALWTKKDVTVNLDLDGGLYNGEITASITSQYKDLVSLSTPIKEGYSFKGWEIISGEGVASGSQYLYSEETFDGSTDYLSIGRDKMYSDKITISLWAYMDNWADYEANKMRLISCTETGGWNFESNSAEIVFANYDSGNGYKHVYTGKKWSSLSSGWHSFTAIFDGVKTILYIDGAMISCSAIYTSGKIGYNSNNAIFIGAEASNNTITPDKIFFNGKISNVVIINEYAYGTQLNQNDSAYLIVESENITIKALWEENAINNKSDSFEEEDGWVNISNANDLARLAYLTNYTDQSEIEGKQFRLTANIDLSNTYWEPIGTESKPFKGVFDGNGYSIIGLHNYTNNDYKYSNSSYIGLFGYTSGAEISHVVIKNASLSGDRYVGGIAGKIDDATTLTNCYVTGGDITSYSRYAGGIVGYISRNSNVVKCISTADVTGYKCVAGLVGGAVYGGTIMTSYAMSNLTLTAVNMTENGTIIGGASTTMSIADCFFVGTSNKEIGTYYGSKYVPQSINSCYVILNDSKTITNGGFTNWTKFDYLNNGLPIQTELIYISNGVSKPDEVLQYFTENSFDLI